MTPSITDRSPGPDPYMDLVTLYFTPDPQRLIWAAMHQCYSSDPVVALPDMDHSAAGHAIVRALLASDRGHYGPLEHPTVTFCAQGFPHSVMQQARTHRVGVSFDCQSFRYTSRNILEVAMGLRAPEEAFYLRPVGTYPDRNGGRFRYTEAMRETDLRLCTQAAIHYRDAMGEGMPEEQARGMLPFDYRQHFLVSFNLRSAFHFLDLRAKLDAQLEVRWLADLVMDRVRLWAPELAEWYEVHRYRKARLAP